MKQRYFMYLVLLLLSVFTGWNANAQVSATANPTTGCRPLPVTFTGTAPGGATFFWDFGDGTQSTLQNPSHTYRKGGYYQAYFYSYSATSVFLGSTYAYVTVGGAPDSLSFSSGNGGSVSGCPGDNVSPSFYLANGANPNSVKWNFGDGYTTTNTYSSTQHVYSALGTYTVTAIVNTSCGTDTCYGKVHVVNNAVITNPYYGKQSDSICPNDAAIFWTDWNYQNYAFDFGDGNVITHVSSPNNNNTEVTHVYATAGNYPIKLTYFNSCGNNTVVRDTIHVTTHQLVTGYFSIDANYGYHSDTACVNSIVQFYPNANAFHAYHWNFGGGAADTSGLQSPTHQYLATGKFVVTLTVINGCGNSQSVTDTVKIVNNLPFGGLTSTLTPDTICPGDAFLYNANSNNNSYNDPSVTYVWNFTDTTSALGSQGSHVLKYPGNYLVKCVGQNGCGSKDSVIQNVHVVAGVIPNKNQFRYTSTASGRAACLGDSVLFIFAPPGNGTVHWDFGDATNANATNSFIFQGTTYRYIKHAYSSNSRFIATVTYTNGCGNAFHDTLGVSVQPNVTDFGSGNGNIIVYDNTQYPCQGSPIAFYALEGSTYVWNFGDGTGNLVTHQTLAPVYHSFANPGKYVVTVRAFNGCGASGVDSATVNVPASLISITTNSVSSHCTKSDGKAIAVVSGGTSPYTYQWSNGKNKSIDDSIPSGIYVITITDLHGCTNYKIATVSDQQAPTITTTIVDVSCYGGNDGAIGISLIGGTSPFTYRWSTGSTNQSINNLVSGPKEITVTDANGCNASKSINVTEPPPVFVSISTHESACGSSTGTATAAVNGTTGPYSYNWSNGGSTPTITGLTPGNYSITVVDNNGCLFYSDATVSNVNGPLIYTDSITGTGCGSALTKIYTHAIAGTSPYTYSWSTGATTADLTNGGVGNYVLTVTGHDGCKSVQDFNIAHDAPLAIPVCIVTVDSATNTDQVLWNNPSSTTIAYCNIYKESSQNGLYYLQDTVQFTSLSQWTDAISNPQVRSWKYKISMVDQCGDESELSQEHKTIHLNINQGIGGVYNLIWDEYIGFSYSTFDIYRLTSTGGWQQIASVPSSVMSYTDVSPPANTSSYRVDAVPNFTCVPAARAAISSTHSNIKTVANFVTGIKNPYLSEQFEVYPNPAEGNVNLIYPPSSDGYHLGVYDALGKLVFATEINKSETTMNTGQKVINLGGLAKGLYIVVLDDGSSKAFKKLILR